MVCTQKKLHFDSIGHEVAHTHETFAKSCALLDLQADANAGQHWLLPNLMLAEGSHQEKVWCLYKLFAQ